MQGEEAGRGLPTESLEAQVCSGGPGALGLLGSAEVQGIGLFGDLALCLHALSEEP